MARMLCLLALLVVEVASLEKSNEKHRVTEVMSSAKGKKEIMRAVAIGDQGQLAGGDGKKPGSVDQVDHLIDELQLDRGIDGNIEAGITSNDEPEAKHNVKKLNAFQKEHQMRHYPKMDKKGPSDEALQEPGSFGTPVEVKPVLSSSAGKEATDAERKMLDAAVAESQTSASAHASARSMVQAAMGKSRDMLIKAQNQVDGMLLKTQGVADGISSEVKKNLDKTVSASEGRLASMKVQTGDIAWRIKTAVADTDMVRVMNDADTLTVNAAELSASIKSDFNTLIGLTTKKANELKASASAASKKIEDVASVISTDGDSMAEQMAEIGLKVSTQMQAKEEANAIVMETASAAEDIKTQVSDFALKAREVAESTTRKGNDLADNLLSQANDKTTEALLNAKRLVDGADATKHMLADAKNTWKNADLEALQTVAEAADVNIHDEATASQPGATAAGGTTASNVSVMFLTVGVVALLVAAVLMSQVLAAKSN